MNFKALFLILPLCVAHARPDKLTGEHSADSVTPICTPTNGDPLTFDNSNWIWTNETTQGVFWGVDSHDNAPDGTRAFRKTVNLAANVSFIDTLMIVDNSYYLWVQGTLVGSGASWTIANRFNITITKPSPTITLAVEGTNSGGPAGLLGAFEAHFVDSSIPPVRFFTDGTWLFSAAATIPTGYQAPAFNDTTWPSVYVEGRHGGPWWGGIQFPITPVTAAT